MNNLAPVSFVSQSERNAIPAILHLIWVGPKSCPVTLPTYVEGWKTLMPNWTVRLWGNDDINDKEFNESALQLIQAANTGVQKADIMRYFILEKYGGVYMDADVEPYRSLDPLLHVPFTTLACHDLPVTWAYISIGFFAATPHHPLFQSCCKMLKNVQLNTDAPHMQTGPRLFGHCISQLATDQPHGLLPIRSFYRNKAGQQWIDGSFLGEDDNSRFGSHLYSKLWD